MSSPQPATTDAITALIEAAKLARYRLPCICRPIGLDIRCSRCALDAAIDGAEPAVASAKSAFTKGPWSFEPIQEWPFGFRVVAASGKCILSESADAHSTEQKTRRDCEAGVGFDWRTEKANGFSREQAMAVIAEQDANARLMSSAPELLEALQAVADDVCGYLCHSQWNAADGRPPCSPACQAVRAAIAKAAGEAK